MKSIYERLDEILPIISAPHFRENKGLGNEVGFYKAISLAECDFKRIAIRSFGKVIKSKLVN